MFDIKVDDRVPKDEIHFKINGITVCKAINVEFNYGRTEEASCIKSEEVKFKPYPDDGRPEVFK